MPAKIDPNEIFCSWQEIADALKVSEKTVRRYEKTEGLRVRRLVTDRGYRTPGKRDRGRVYATGRMLLEFLEGQESRPSGRGNVR